jgi:hypothetical protein
MKRLIALSVSMLMLGFAAFATDSTGHKIKKTTHHVATKTKETSHKLGKKIDTGAKKTGHFFKRSANAVASTVASSQDKSMKGPHGEVVYNGKSGGKYYIAKSGTKVYLKKDKPEVAK